MGRLSDYGRTRVIHLHNQNYSSKQIAETLKEEDIITTSRAIQRLIKKVQFDWNNERLKKEWQTCKSIGGDKRNNQRRDELSFKKIKNLITLYENLFELVFYSDKENCFYSSITISHDKQVVTF